MNFIKLTRFDNRPVWLNAGFIVTVEPRRDGVGAVVVPIGDGLDYDVRETPEEVLKMLSTVPASSVVPVPVLDDGLTPTPEDVSPEPAIEAGREESAVLQTGVQPEQPVETKKPRRRVAKAVRSEDDRQSKTPRKSTGRKVTKKAAPLELSDNEIVRLLKLSPKTVDKLRNTLLTQFHIADVAATLQGLEAKGVFSVDGKRIVWQEVDRIAGVGLDA